MEYPFKGVQFGAHKHMNVDHVHVL